MRSARSASRMAYQWELPYPVDDGAFRRAFGVGPTRLDEAIDATLAAHAPQRAAA